MRLSSRLSDENKQAGEVESIFNFEKYVFSSDKDCDAETTESLSMQGILSELRLGKFSCRFIQASVMTLFLLHLFQTFIA